MANPNDSPRAERVTDPSRRACLAAFAGWAALLAGCGGGGGEQADAPVAGDVDGASAGATWQTGWLAAVQAVRASAPGLPVPPPLVLRDQTLRHVLRPSQGGASLRLRISNAFGSEPLVIDGVNIARVVAGSRIDPATDQALRFGGATAARVPAGGEVWSDELDFAVTAREAVAISLYVAGPMEVSTWHAGAFQTGRIAQGDARAAESLDEAPGTGAVHWLRRLDVRVPRPGGVVVAFGDSITEGALSTPDAHRRYTDQLDARLAADAGLAGWGVVNAGLGGNRLLFDGFGPRALDRFERDVLQVAGARAAIVLIGINDLHAPAAGIGPVVAAEELVKGLQELVRRGRQAGLRMMLATLPPCEGYGYATAASEAGRQALNAWIRAQSLADAVLDVDRVLRDPAAPTRLLAAFDSGDRLHPNDAGMAAIAQAVDLQALRSAG